MAKRHQLVGTALAAAMLATIALIAVYTVTLDDESSSLVSLASSTNPKVQLAVKTVMTIASPALKLAHDVSKSIKFVSASESTELVPIKPPPMTEPWSAPDNVYVFWSRANVDVVNTGETVRHILKIGTIDGGEYRSDHFIHDLSKQQFRDLTLTCCSVLVFPPLDHGFPIYGLGTRLQRRISRYVANGNTMIFTGDMMATMFINSIFGYNIEPVPNNYSPGPFLKYNPAKLPESIKKLDDTLVQDGTQVTPIHKFSLPVGTTVFFASPNGSPFFSIKYCEVMNPKKGEPPIKVRPDSCDKWKKKNVECGCGNIVYVGFDFLDEDNERWNAALRATLGLVIGKDEN